jgi:hypothetical protein
MLKRLLISNKNINVLGVEIKNWIIAQLRKRLKNKRIQKKNKKRKPRVKKKRKKRTVIMLRMIMLLFILIIIFSREDLTKIVKNYNVSLNIIH